MSAEQDPIAVGPAPDRLYYATGVLLDAEDFRDEQTYHRGRLARALAALHGSGTVAGLRVEYQPATSAQEEEIVVYPGIALDRLGRLIEVPRRACIRLDRWYQAQAADVLEEARHPKPLPDPPPDPYSGVVVDVFLRFLICERGKTPAFSAGPFDALDAVAPSRLRDAYEIALVPRPEGRPKLPRSAWPDMLVINDPEQRREALRKAVYALWTDGQSVSPDTPEPAEEYLAGQDRSAVFLARLEIPADPPAHPGQRPQRINDPVRLHDEDRMLVFRMRALL